MERSKLPNVSIVIPTYNRAHLISQSLDSVLCQTYSDYEIIVVDDGSVDETRKNLDIYSDRVKYIYQTNKGVSAARNHGIEEAKGEWISFLDSDDLWLPNKLEKQLEYVKDKDVIYSHRADWFIDDENDASLLYKCEGVTWPVVDQDGMVVNPTLSVAQADPYMTPALLCHRSCFDKIGYFEEDLTAGEDEDWLSRASLELRFHFLDESLARIRYHRNQTGLESEKSVRSLIRVMERMYRRTESIDAKASRVAKVRYASKLSHLANILARQGKKQEALRHVLQAYGANPRQVSRLFKAGMIAVGLK